MTAAIAVIALAASPVLGVPAGTKAIFEAYRDNVVAVTYTLRPKEKPTGGEGRKVEEAICGVIVDDRGLVVTTADPFPDLGGDPRTTLIPVQFSVHLPGNRIYPAEAVGLDRDLNLAFLRITDPPAGLRNIPFDRMMQMDVGDDVIVIGLMSSEYDYAPTLQRGMVSAVLDRPRRMYGLDLYVQDLSIGGLVVTGAGDPVGIVGEDILEDSPSTESMPANVLSIFGSFAQGRRVGYPMVFPFSVFAGSLEAPPPIPVTESRSWIGIIMQPLNEDLIEYWDLDVDGGIIISSVIEGSPAEGAGLQVADIIVGLEGEPLKVTKEEELAGFRRSIEQMGVGAEAHLSLLRGGEKHELALRLGEAPVTAFTAEEFEDEDLGLTVREITLNDLQGQNLEPDTVGVVVSELEQAGWSQLAGIQPGDIIQAVDRQRVTNLSSFREEAERLRENRPRSTVFFVLRQIETLFVPIKTPWK